ncbi:MAG TPA: cytochrome C oxidase subunit IV family protein [Candidatus Sulfotelmatobacter sp.]|nr:cytochrome C oxidase subunit IV family protein [Candidatus Sulfotelmatobacter sp.]
MAQTEEHVSSGGIGRYLLVYLAILVLAGLQFVIAYQHIDGSQMFARMFFIALAEAGLGLMFFMHLWEEKRGLLLFVAVFTIFVIAAMQYGWPDSFRMLVGVPGASN